MKGYLVLENGSIYEGETFGAERELQTELVFSTGMTGYQESITDPSYYGQGLVFTYPLIGNTGMNQSDQESPRPAVDAIIVKELTRRPSNFRSQSSLADYALQQDLVGLQGVDTRRLAREIRQQGTLKAVLVHHLADDKIKALFATDHVAKRPATAETDQGNDYQPTGPARYHVVLLDFGFKASIVQALLDRQVRVTVCQPNSSLAEIERYQPDGVLLSNGPGDPSQYRTALPLIRALQDRYPLFGICLGHQLLALANGAQTYPLPFGYRGFNHIVWDLERQQKRFTAQNHGYAVDKASLATTPLIVTHEEYNQRTVEGLRHQTQPAFSVQFHPDACPGPHDSDYVFDHFLELMQGESRHHA
ncbi:carbamoyl phosphate synthase small subunit [Leuconostocaceae bacterium ESL0958]|nr:carbamoyl phosphate synthase small subunit [Leuconostocaceae bacterium ESL0958]